MGFVTTAWSGHQFTSNKRLDVQDECVTTDSVIIHANETICTGVKTSQMQSWRTKSVLPGDAVLHIWDVSRELEGMVHCPWALVDSALTK